MKCLTDAQIQAVVDDEAPDDVRGHAASCAGCGERVSERRALTDDVIGLIQIPAAMPPGLALRVGRALDHDATAGATRLRTGEGPSRRWPAPVWSAGAAAAATLAIVVGALIFRDPATVSAAEILARSADRLATPVASGVESLVYELALDGVPRQMMPDHIDGAYLVKQAIDHDTPGRYLVAAYASSGQLVWAVAQDPATRRRVIALRVDGQPYRFEFAVDGSVAFTPPEMERLHMETTVAMMRASGNQQLEVVEGPDGPQYRVDVPAVSTETPQAMWDLHEARAVIDATDYHVVELAVKGMFLKQPYSVSYRLIARTIVSQDGVADGTFSLPADAGAMTLEGEGSAVPVRDALVLALRELHRLKQGR